LSRIPMTTSIIIYEDYRLRLAGIFDLRDLLIKT
jgi:hypothetical protein